ncbi:OmpA family protein [Campylobacter ureolyticus]|uniref:OmpA family protein n=1 Tax=Campylobacter ureolyticus TaxID=827 RepID=A0A9Q4PUD1_9BACT|nr:OmpA family protein [Campylobacter ureolyticus]MCZ6104351.1 OmpA family protein [Campylobacter ureolyticus]MCZ6135605.1 OmpA family protein [Campylobacter ureolyticus]MCZ6162353.1 OmpA family protein [Campylobacter ureolyticus]MCZ6171412.1 OmpA family protein [Campylobacter ureolyticus]MDU4981765.1 OmpA family protein [Campylobacter ureolyticus]
MKKVISLVFALFFLTGCAELTTAINKIGSLSPFNTNTKVDTNKPLTLFVVDTSGSMASLDTYTLSSRIGSAKKNIKDIAYKLDTSKTNVAVIDFGRNCEVSIKLKPTDNINSLISTVDSLNADGNTPLAGAIRKAGSLASSSNTAVHIILLSDGVATCGGDPKQEIDRLVRNNPNIKISTFIIGYSVDDMARNQLQNLIVGDGGYFDVNDASAMVTALNKITTKLNISQSGWENSIYNFQINFDHDSDIIKPEFMQNVRNLANYLINTGNGAEIQGHTDDIGDANYNKNLSKRRAISVRNTLISLGVNKNKLKAIGYGKERPKVSNTSSSNRYQNRRVEAHIF